MTEIRIRVKPIVKEKLERFKEKTGLSLNYIVNWCLVKFMILEHLMTPAEYDARVEVNMEKRVEFSELHPPPPSIPTMPTPEPTALPSEMLTELKTVLEKYYVED